MGAYQELGSIPVWSIIENNVSVSYNPQDLNWGIFIYWNQLNILKLKSGDFNMTELIDGWYHHDIREVGNLTFERISGQWINWGNTGIKEILPHPDYWTSNSRRLIDTPFFTLNSLGILWEYDKQTVLIPYNRMILIQSEWYGKPVQWDLYKQILDRSINQKMSNLFTNFFDDDLVIPVIENIGVSTKGCFVKEGTWPWAVQQLLEGKTVKRLNKKFKLNPDHIKTEQVSKGYIPFPGVKVDDWNATDWIVVE